MRQNGYAALQKELNTPDSTFKLSIANALWAQKDYPFTSTFLQTTQRAYSANVTNVDYRENPEKSRVMINDWVEEKTYHKIKDLIPSGIINKQTRLVLTNAIYFKGDWQTAFEKNRTNEDNFKLANGNSQKVSMMSYQKEASLLYTETDSLQIVDLPYKGDKLSMMVILPKYDGILNEISLSKVKKWTLDLEEQRVRVLLPKFKLETQYMMSEDLKQMGMPLAFTEHADFSGMTTTNLIHKLRISEVIHKAFIEVNEEGTEAAAATAVVMVEITSAHLNPPIKIFKADHPFVFIIKHKSSGAILFMGRVDKI